VNLLVIDGRLRITAGESHHWGFRVNRNIQHKYVFASQNQRLIRHRTKISEDNPKLKIRPLVDQQKKGSRKGPSRGERGKKIEENFGNPKILFFALILKRTNGILTRKSVRMKQLFLLISKKKNQQRGGRREIRR